MTGHKPFSDLTRDFTPARRARVAAKAAALGEKSADPNTKLFKAHADRVRVRLAAPAAPTPAGR